MGQKEQALEQALQDPENELVEDGALPQDADTAVIEVKAPPAQATNENAPPTANQPVCAITGLPAKYKDPLTKQPYANAEAFKELRRRYNQENNITEQPQQPPSEVTLEWGVEGGDAAPAADGLELIAPKEKPLIQAG